MLINSSKSMARNKIKKSKVFFPGTRERWSSSSWLDGSERIALYKGSHIRTHRRRARSRSIVHTAHPNHERENSRTAQSIRMIESMEGTQEDIGGNPSLALCTNESLVAIVRMEFRTVIKPIGVTSVSIGGLLYIYSFFYTVHVFFLFLTSSSITRWQ